MRFNDLLTSSGIDQRQVILLRHRPPERELQRALPWMAESQPELFNAYQQFQTNPRLVAAMSRLSGTGYVASFIGTTARRALFVGLFQIGEMRRLEWDEFRREPHVRTLQESGMQGPNESLRTVPRFNLLLHDFYAHWRGRLVVELPPPDISWWRRVHRTEITVEAVLEESALSRALPHWQDIDLSWSDIALLPPKWKDALSHWRGIYCIWDKSDRMAYVGSAYGEGNILGRWQTYSSTGHGANKHLRARDPKNFRFTILQRVSPDLEPTSVINLENSWKARLHTHWPNGLNDN
jgi:hypothetical protein